MQTIDQIDNREKQDREDFECMCCGVDCFSDTPAPEYAEGKYKDSLIQTQWEAFQAGVSHARNQEGEKIACRLAEIDQETYDFDASCEDEAKRRGATVIYPEPNQLQIDLDGEDAVAEFNRRLSYWDFGKSEPYEVDERNSRKPGHLHVTITVKGKTFSDVERIAIQAALGSDTIREYLNLMRHYAGVEKPSRLFLYPEVSK